MRSNVSGMFPLAYAVMTSSNKPLPIIHNVDTILTSKGSSECNKMYVGIANLIMEIRDPSLIFDGLVQYELSQLVNYLILSMRCVHHSCVAKWLM